MRNHTASPDLLLTPLRNESQQSVKRTAGLEGADPLVILAFEEESELGIRRCLAFEGRSDQ
jgi:hypothetical protein